MSKLKKLPYEFDLLYDIKTLKDVEDIAHGRPTGCEGSVEDLIKLFKESNLPVPDCLKRQAVNLTDKEKVKLARAEIRTTLKKYNCELFQGGTIDREYGSEIGVKHEKHFQVYTATLYI